MFRTADVTREVIEALLSCDMPQDYELNVIVVDDASGDGSAEAIEASMAACVRVVRNTTNVGRSRTRNRGAQLAEPGLLLFLDSDCIPANSAFLHRHLEAMSAGGDISVGSITGMGDGFWHRYQQRVAERRAVIAAREGAAKAATSPNFMIRREAFIQLNGFDEAYRGYGFEDRDFFLRADAQGLRTAWSGLAVAIHADRLRLDTLCRKMREAGGDPAARFAQAHPEAYASLGYAALDARRHPWLRWLRPVTSWIAKQLIAFADPRMESSRLPFTLRSAIVRLVVAASYLEGSAKPLTPP